MSVWGRARVLIMSPRESQWKLWCLALWVTSLWVWVWYWELLTHWLPWCHGIAWVNTAMPEWPPPPPLSTPICQQMMHMGCIVMKWAKWHLLSFGPQVSLFMPVSFLFQLTYVIHLGFMLQGHNDTMQCTCTCHCMGPNDISSFGPQVSFCLFVSSFSLPPEPLPWATARRVKMGNNDDQQGTETQNGLGQEMGPNDVDFYWHLGPRYLIYLLYFSFLTNQCFYFIFRFW